MLGVYSLLTLLLASTAVAHRHRGRHVHIRPPSSTGAAAAAHPTTYSNYLFRFTGTDPVNVDEILDSLQPYGFNMSHLHHTFSETMNGFSALMSDHCVGVLKDMVTPDGVQIEPVVTMKLRVPVASTIPKPQRPFVDHRKRGAHIRHNHVHTHYKPAIRPRGPGFSIATRIGEDPVESSPASSAIPSPSTVPAADDDVPAEYDILQTDATWGLQRISQRNPILGVADTDVNGQNFKYKFDESAGEGVDIYVIDTGINTAHKDFGGRAKVEFVAQSLVNSEGPGDFAGHGTHCAGTTGSMHYGVAKRANIYGIKIMGRSGGGLSSDIAAGIEHMVKRHRQRRLDPTFRGSVASMSFGLDVATADLGNSSVISKSPVLDSVIMAAAAEGIHTVIAGGNQGIDACRVSPGYLSRAVGLRGNYSASVITVGAADVFDNRADFSNYGECITTYAPGVAVLSTYINGDNSTQVLQGTSMAAPHVAGLVAYLLGLRPELKEDVQGMKRLLTSTAGRGLIGNVVDAEDKRLVAYNGVDG
ncbi:Cerevisin [Drechslerella dactyloides]|uniref:Cerevisin n=1 Tax=Drechslerella dactyloides TaxID=74499 RepID=A0AAD6IZ14_DREDA|nr:Cerevisin [Drechslerella dactyloides]